MVVRDGEVIGLVWHATGYSIDVLYDDGPPGFIRGKKESEAAQLAASLGLSLAERSQGTVRWIKHRGEDEPA